MTNAPHIPKAAMTAIIMITVLIFMTRIGTRTMPFQWYRVVVALVVVLIIVLAACLVQVRSERRPSSPDLAIRHAF